MAIPTVEALCCLSSRYSLERFIDAFHITPYNIVSIVSSLLGILGAVYQIFIRGNLKEQQRDRNRVVRRRGRLIIGWLALADMMASFGIFVRSLAWLTDSFKPYNAQRSSTSHSFCIIISIWIHYFYTATYFWTLIYAIDVRYLVKNRRVDLSIYHAVGWILPGVFCLVGLLSLYLPDLDCHRESVNPLMRFLPNYLSTFVPVLLVMVANPILYCVSFSSVERLMVASRGRFTGAERHILNGLRLKFALINVVFYVCWTPNVLNGLVLWSSWKEFPKFFITVIWFLMAALNPLQAFLNCLVYRNWSRETVDSNVHMGYSSFWPREGEVPMSTYQVPARSSLKEQEISSSSEEEELHLFYAAHPWNRSQDGMRSKANLEKTPLLSPTAPPAF